MLFVWWRMNVFFIIILFINIVVKNILRKGVYRLILGFFLSEKYDF